MLIGKRFKGEIVWDQYRIDLNNIGLLAIDFPEQT
jgi:hypothetical protein